MGGFPVRIPYTWLPLILKHSISRAMDKEDSLLKAEGRKCKSQVHFKVTAFNKDTKQF